MDLALSALRRVNFDWTAHIDEIWVDQRHETDQLQAPIRGELEEYVDDLIESDQTGSPLGVPLVGPAGSGKTHLLGMLRRQSLARGAYFILADMTDVADFWETVSLGYLRSLQQPLADGRRQVDHWLERMIRLFGQETRKATDIPKQRPPGLINRTEELIKQARLKHRAEIQEHADVFRALVLFACDHADINDLGYKWLQGLVIDREELGIFGFNQSNQTPSRIVRGLSWLLSLTAPTVLALDQLDAIVAEHELARGTGGESPDDDDLPEQQRRSLAIIQGIAGGLRELRDVTKRTLTVVSSLEASWDILDRQAKVSMADRYNAKLLLKPGSGPAVYKELVSGRLRPAYEKAGYTPPFPSFPYGDSFFETHRHNTPRELLKACDAHRKACRKAGIVTEAGKVLPHPVVGPDSRWKGSITELVASRASSADLSKLLADESEALQDRIIETACDALLQENPIPESVFAKVEKDFMGTGTYDPLHARVRLIFNDERERHHSFRFLQKHHYRAFQARLKAALTASGIDERLSFRGLTIIRVGEPPSGKVSNELVADLRARGGRLVSPSEQDLRLLLAIHELMDTDQEPEHFDQWLAQERPVSKMAAFEGAAQMLVRATTASTEKPPAAQPTPNPMPAPTVKSAAAPAPKPQPTAVSAVPPTPVGASVSPAGTTILPLGRRLSEPHDEIGIPVERLPYHTCVFAGSGSGKTVFLKRVIEEAALLGIPSIVLDGANDLSRLGMPWPERPDVFSDVDVQKAAEYQARSEVVVWTPGAASGNPMRLSPLPDFENSAGAPTEQDDEFRSVLDVATSSIASLIIKPGGKAATRQTAILKGTLKYVAQRRGTIRDLVALLREPPEEVTDPYEKGDKLARELSELLHAEIENDPLIGGSGTPLDPSVLFRAADPSKTRVSVLNLVGLPSYDQKRRFVDQLSGTLFTWIKKNPAPPGGILGLLVVDEAKDFVPSGKSVPGRENMIRLAAQARKYGLGLLFATQEPKSIDHAIVSNCSTLLGGKMSSPAAIDALQQLLSDKGTHATDVAALKRGTFYFGSAPDKPRKVATSLCLSYHPSTPPSEAEVLESARRSAQVINSAQDS